MASERHDILAARFEALLPRLGGTGGAELFARLAARYREPHRRYHDLAHIGRCLGELDGARDLAERPDEVEAAIFFHDAIYDPLAADNEEQSALLADAELLAAGVPPEVCLRVADLIRATVHRDPPESPDAALLVDIDLAGLADDFEDFTAAGHRIREEFAHVPEEAFTAGRRSFFRSLFDRPSIYRTPRFRARLEARARENLRRLFEPRV